MLKPQDIFLLVKFNLLTEPQTQVGLATDLFISASEVNAGIKRLLQAHLLKVKSDYWQVDQKSMMDFLVYGLVFCFPAQRGEPTVGVRVDPEWGRFKSRSTWLEMLPVWPDAEGKQSGFSLKPLYHSVPKACRCDFALYQWLMVIDTLRDWQNPNRSIAKAWLKSQLLAKSRSEIDLNGLNQTRHQITLFQ